MKQAVNWVVFLATLYIAAKFLMAKAQPRAELAQGEFDFTGLKESLSVQNADFNELIVECAPQCEYDSVLAKPLSVLQKYQAAYDAYQNNLLNCEKYKTEMDKYRSLAETDISHAQYENYNQAQLDYVLASSAAEKNLRDIRNIPKNINIVGQLQSVIPTLRQDLAKIKKFYESIKPDVLDSTLDDLSQRDRSILEADYRQASDNQLQELKIRLISKVKLLRALLTVDKMTHSLVDAETTSSDLDDNLIRLLSLIDVHNNKELPRNLNQAEELVLTIQPEQKSIRSNRLEEWPQILADTLNKSIEQWSRKTSGVSKGLNTPGTPKQEVLVAFDDLRQHYQELHEKSQSWKSTEYSQYDGINDIFDKVASIQSALDTQVSNNGAADPTGEYSTNMIDLICQSKNPVLKPILLTDVRDKNNKLHLSESETADSNIVNRYENSTENPIHVIHHRDNNHFVAAAIYRDDDNKTHIIVHDPLGNPNNTTVRIANLLGDSAQPTIHQNGKNDIHNQHNLQQDHINCGPLSIELISRLDEKTCARIAKRQKTVSSISTDIAESAPYKSRSGEWSQVSKDAANLLRAEQFRSVVDHCKKLNDNLPLMNNTDSPSP